MKKLIAPILAGAFSLFSLFGCAEIPDNTDGEKNAVFEETAGNTLTGDISAVENTRHESGIIHKEPPMLRIICGDKSIQALKGTFSWWYDNGDGTSAGIEADSMHPLDSKEHIETLEVNTTYISSNERCTVSLMFDGTPPDSIRVRCWGDDMWDIPSAESRDILTNGLSFELENGGHIYEIIAEWNDRGGFGGTAHYSFYGIYNQMCALPAAE